MTRRRLWPGSLFGRLLAIGVAATGAALLFAGITIGHVLERFVMHGLDDRLDAQVAVLAGALRPDGTIDPARAVDLPGFGIPGSGWIWSVTRADGRRWGSGADGVLLPLVVADRPPFPAGLSPEPPGRPHMPRPADVRDRHGDRLHLRAIVIPTRAGAVTIVAGGPRRIVAAPLHEAMVPLLVTLALLGGGLMAAMLVQLRVGLRPLRRLRIALAEVIAGERRHVPPEGQPAELLPLVGELNLLIDRNAAGLDHARRHVANLAHGLKTPLAALALKLDETGRDPDGALTAMVARIDRRIAHHLRRARAAAPGGTQRARTPLAPAIGDLLAVLRRVHADRPIVVGAAIDPTLIVAVDPQDLDEMLGNLLDNAWRHARSAIRVDAMAGAGMIALTIEDDGPGLDDAALAEARVPGRRIDESGVGYGFGLSITDELADLNGGGLALVRSPRTGGLLATLTLPIGRAV